MTDDERELAEYNLIAGAENAAAAARYGPLPDWVGEPVRVDNHPDGDCREIIVIERKAHRLYIDGYVTEAVDNGQSEWRVEADVETNRLRGLNIDQLREIRDELDAVIAHLEDLESRRPRT